MPSAVVLQQLLHELATEPLGILLLRCLQAMKQHLEQAAAGKRQLTVVGAWQPGRACCMAFADMSCEQCHGQCHGDSSTGLRVMLRYQKGCQQRIVQRVFAPVAATLHAC
jgi:hypothetical protein